MAEYVFTDAEGKTAGSTRDRKEAESRAQALGGEVVVLPELNPNWAKGALLENKKSSVQTLDFAGQNCDPAASSARFIALLTESTEGEVRCGILEQGDEIAKIIVRWDDPQRGFTLRKLMLDFILKAPWVVGRDGRERCWQMPQEVCW